MEGNTNMITNAVSEILGVATTVLDYIVENPTLSIFFFAGLIGLGIGVVKKLKH